MSESKREHLTHRIIILLGIFAVIVASAQYYDISKIRKSGEENHLTNYDGKYILSCLEVDSIIPVDSFYKGSETTFKLMLEPVKKTKGIVKNSTYENYCASCHSNSIMGAPKVLPEKPLDTLVKNAINGYNKMPPKGLCQDCDSLKITSTILWMKNNLK